MEQEKTKSKKARIIVLCIVVILILSFIFFSIFDLSKKKGIQDDILTWKLYEDEKSRVSFLYPDLVYTQFKEQRTNNSYLLELDVLNHSNGLITNNSVIITRFVARTMSFVDLVPFVQNRYRDFNRTVLFESSANVSNYTVFHIISSIDDSYKYISGRNSRQITDEYFVNINDTEILTFSKIVSTISDYDPSYFPQMLESIIIK